MCGLNAPLKLNVLEPQSPNPPSNGIRRQFLKEMIVAGGLCLH